MTTVYMAVLLSFFGQGMAQDTIWAPTLDECQSLVRQWKAQPPYDVGRAIHRVRFDGYCKPMQVESEWPSKVLNNG